MKPRSAGCDQSTVYQCGVQSSSASPPVVVDLGENPGAGTNDTMNGAMCLIHEQPDGQDALNTSAYPFQILSGTSNPLSGAGLASGSVITSSNSIVSLPIYDDTQGTWHDHPDPPPTSPSSDSCRCSSTRSISGAIST